MFEIGTYIVCGQHGVCRVEDIGKLKLSEASGNKDYYTLSQVYSCLLYTSQSMVTAYMRIS